MISLRRMLACWLILAAAPLGSRGQSPAPAYKPAANDDEAIKRIEQLGGSVRKVVDDSDALEVDLHNTTANDDHLQYLLILKNVAVIRLRECSVGDAGLIHLGKIAGLKKLHLEKTAVSDAGLKHLVGLKSLEVLNLYGCQKVTDAGLVHLQSHSQLKSLFVTDTKATETGITALQKAIPKLVIIPNRALERQRADAAWDTAKKALAEMEVRFEKAKNEAELLTPRVAELKKTVDEAMKKLNDVKSKGGGAVTEAQAALKAAQAQHSKAANAAKDFDLAKKHLEAHRQLEVDARARVEEFRTK